MNKQYAKPAPAQSIHSVAGNTIVLIPAHNEEKSITRVIEDILSVASLSILVIDDESTDNTAAKARAAGAEVVSLPVQLGAWSAVQTGLRYASKNQYSFAITMDADGQHLASSLEELVQPVVNGHTDVSIGACRGRGSWQRSVAWRLLKSTSNLTADDITSGLRVYNHKAIETLSGEEASMLEFQDVGVLLLLKSRELHIADVQIEMLPRDDGGSRVFSSWGRVIYYMLLTLLLGLSKRSMKQLSTLQSSTNSCE